MRRRGAAIGAMLAALATVGCGPPLHPLLGLKTTGQPTWSLLTRGQAYRDPQDRFAVPVQEPVWHVETDEGVVLSATGPSPLDRRSYAVFVLPRARDPSGKRFALLSTAQRMQVRLERQWIRMRVLREIQTTVDQMPAMELDVVLSDTWQRTLDHVALIRLVERGQQVLWMCVAQPVVDEPVVTEAHRRRAEEFFASVQTAVAVPRSSGVGGWGVPSPPSAPVPSTEP